MYKGCGINLMDGSCFYTKNGHHLGVAFRGKHLVHVHGTIQSTVVYIKVFINDYYFSKWRAQ